MRTEERLGVEYWVWKLTIVTGLGNSAVATELEKVCFHANPKERQCQRMLKLPHSCTHHGNPLENPMDAGAW